MDVEFKIEVAVSRFGRGHDAVTLRDISPEPRFQVPQLFHSLNARHDRPAATFGAMTEDPP